MAGLLSETFGQAGTAVTFFGGNWWLVGLFLLLVFVTFLASYRVSAQGISFVIVIGLLTVGFYELFYIQEQITQTIMLFVFIFIGYLAYLFFSR